MPANIPPASAASPAPAFEHLLTIMDTLREQCPWDQKQTMESLRHLTIEETYELSDAILDGDVQEIRKELGDLMLHLVFYARIATETQQFTITEVLNGICDKLISRHPHIYGDITVKDEAEVKRNWEQLKLKEGNKSVLGGVPSSLPALIKASRIQEKARGVGFDWEEPQQVWEKVLEELAELNEEIKKGLNFCESHGWEKHPNFDYAWLQIERTVVKLKNQNSRNNHLKILEGSSNFLTINSFIGSEIGDPTSESAEKAPRSAKHVVTISWSWSPMHSRTSEYRIATDKNRAGWHLYEITEGDLNDKKLCSRVSSGYPYKGVTVDRAAYLLLKAAWESEVEQWEFDPSGFEVDKSGLLTEKEILEEKVNNLETENQQLKNQIENQNILINQILERLQNLENNN